MSGFSKKSLKCAIGAIQSHLWELGQALKDFPDYAFTGAKKDVDGVLKQRKCDCFKKHVQHDAPITNEGWKKLDDYFRDMQDTNDIVKMSLKLNSQFCMRGGEIQASIKTDDLHLSVVDGKKILKLTPSYLSKNLQGKIHVSDWTSAV